MLNRLFSAARRPINTKFAAVVPANTPITNTNPDFDEILATTSHAISSMTMTNHEMRESVKNMMENRGFSNANVGHGNLCVGVAKHPDIVGKVYKLVLNAPDLDPYILYAEWVKSDNKWETNPHFPRIYDIVYSEDNMVALVVMEELEELNAYGLETLKEQPSFLHEDWATAASCIQRSVRVEASKGPTSLIHAAKMVRKTFLPDPRVFFDTHGYNFMVRGGSVLVITDPLAPNI